MAEKKIILEESKRPQQVDVYSEAFEKAYFTNSYPQESAKVAKLVTWIKIVAVGAILLEVVIGASISADVYQYSQIVEKVDSVI